MQNRSNRSVSLPSPLKLFFLVLLIVFFAEGMVMFLLMVLPKTTVFTQALIDSSLLTLLVSPFLWWLVVRPLRGTAVQESLRASNIINNTMEGIITLDEKGQVVSLNPAGEDLFGYSAGELRGQSLENIIVPQGSKMIYDYIAGCAQSAKKQATGFFQEVIGQHKEGKSFPLDFSLTVLYTDNALLFTGFLRDITERKQIEEKLRGAKEFVETVLNSMDDAISIIDTENFAILGVNRSFLEGVGMEEKEVLGKPCYEITHHRGEPCVPPHDVCPLGETVESGSYAVAEHVHYTSKGERIYVEIRTSPIKGRNGKVIRVVHVARNITAHKKAEEELKAYAEKLQSSYKELEDFLYIASHDLQEPLRKVIAFSQRIKSRYAEVLDQQGKDYFDRMQNSIDRMQCLIEDLLQFSRLTTRAQPFVAVDFSKLTQEIVADWKSKIEQCGGQVELGTLHTIEADQSQMRQLLRHLIDNGLKFHKKDEPPVVKVTGSFLHGNEEDFRAGIRSNKFYQLTVEDNGIGFDQKYVDRIFGIFQRLHGKNEYQGTGIGLSVCRKIVDRHGGTITAHASSGQGAIFRITLPVTQSQVAQGQSSGVSNPYPA